jgi:hypothetical protein
MTKREEDRTKLANIFPPPEKFGKYPELVDFFFSIQDLYKYNPQAYEEVVFNVDSMMTIYEDVKKEVRHCKENHDVAEEKKRNAINALHSIVYSLEDNQVVTRKLNRSVRILQKLLTQFTDEILEDCKLMVDRNGFDTKKHYIELNKGPRAYNEYVQDDFTFDVY